LERQLELAAVLAPVERDRVPRVSGAHDIGRRDSDEALLRRRLVGRAHRELELRANHDRAGRDHVVDSRTVAEEERHGRGDGCGRASVREQHAHDLSARAADRRAGVVVREDLPVRAACVRLAVCAVLAHPDAVPPATAGDDEQRLAGSRGRGLLRGGDAAAGERENEYESREEAQSDGPG
jgi:hypothetical protein